MEIEVTKAKKGLKSLNPFIYRAELDVHPELSSDVITGLNPFIYRAELDAQDSPDSEHRPGLNPFIYRAELDDFPFRTRRSAECLNPFIYRAELDERRMLFLFLFSDLERVFTTFPVFFGLMSRMVTFPGMKS